MNTTLFHVCCGPCSTVLSSYKKGYEEPLATFFYNPNIQPQGEHDQRSATFMAYAKSLGYTVIQGEYDSDLWKAAVGEKCGVFPLIESALDYAENLKKRRNRCRACFAFRFEALAEVARQQRFRTIATTLSVSPYQFTDILREELQEAAHRHSLESLFVDFREFYPETVKLSRALGMYRQKYCGCLDSKKEAELEHLARAEAKKRARTQKIKDTDEH